MLGIEGFDLNMTIRRNPSSSVSSSVVELVYAKVEATPREGKNAERDRKYTISKQC
jgi:hypothetical protein